MGKDAIFKPPFRGLMMWMGGIPIDRSKSNNVVGESIAALKEAQQLILLVPPEGTRSKVTVWKTGFYHIAHGAGVPILLGFLDFKEKAGGIGPALMPTGDIDADMREIKAFYATKTGKNAHHYHGDH
jgi:1-acyl-sn-glycerol-3-phosphate acyltransferase